MAKQVVITDDINGEPGAETQLIILNGKGIEIDLGAKSLERLTKALQPFWEAGSEGDYEVTRRLGKRRAAANGDQPRRAGRPPGGTKLSDDDLVAYVRDHPGASNKQMAEVFDVTAGSIAKRCKERPDLFRAEFERHEGSRGQSSLHYYPV